MANQVLTSALSFMKPYWSTVGLIAFATVAIFAVAIHLTAPQPPKAALVNHTTASVINTVASGQAHEDQQHATAKEAIAHVQATSHASVPLDDTGHAGLVGLCSLGVYASDPACKLFRDDTGQLQKAGGGSASSGQ